MCPTTVLLVHKNPKDVLEKLFLYDIWCAQSCSFRAVFGGYRSLVRRVICPKDHMSEIVQIQKFDAIPNPKPNPNPNASHNLNSNLNKPIIDLALTLTQCLYFSDKWPFEQVNCYHLTAFFGPAFDGTYNFRFRSGSTTAHWSYDPNPNPNPNPTLTLTL